MRRTKRLRVPDEGPLARRQGRTVRVVLPEWLRQGFEEQVQREYGKRGGSRWVDEALLQLTRHKAWDELLIGKSDVTDGRAKQFNLSPLGAEALDKAIEVVRRGDPYFEGVISEIVRSAIAQRLLRSGYLGRTSAR